MKFTLNIYTEAFFKYEKVTSHLSSNKVNYRIIDCNNIVLENVIQNESREYFLIFKYILRTSYSK